MREMKCATILGANGTMGAGSAAILAGFGGMKVNMLARSLKKAEEGIAHAVETVRSSVITNHMTPGTYNDDLERCVAESDWVFELVAESYDIKETINRRIAESRRPGTLVSTVSSGLSIERLAKVFDEDGRRHYYGTHFFNPPYKLVLCELVTHSGSDSDYTAELARFLEQKLHRHVIIANDRPAFAGNRIGFQFMNEVALMAEKESASGGIALMDAILSGYTGRAMPPLATIDLVGIDVHKAIVDNIYWNTKDRAHETFQLPAFMEDCIEKGSLGNKSGRGLYKRVKNEDGTKETLVLQPESGTYGTIPQFELPFKSRAMDFIKNSDYSSAIQAIREADGREGELLRYFIARYIGYSYSLIPDVTDRDGVDGAMGFGFNWVPPSVWADLLGGVVETRKFLEKAGIEVPPYLADLKEQRLYNLGHRLDWRSLFRAG